MKSLFIVLNIARKHLYTQSIYIYYYLFLASNVHENVNLDSGIFGVTYMFFKRSCNICLYMRENSKMCNNNAISGKDAGSVSNHLARKTSVCSQWDH